MATTFLERLARGAILCDGAMGTQLYARGVHDLPLELANVNHPDIVRSIHLDYLQAGSELLETNTFGANAARLAASGMEDRVEELNRAGVALAQQARDLHGQQVWIAGALGPLGREGGATGALDSGTGANAFAEQASVLAVAGVDLFVLETFASLAELRLALNAVRSVSGLPIIAQLTFTDDGLTPAGDTPEAIAVALSEANVAAFGANCSVGPAVIRRVMERMAPFADAPLAAQPNAGLPAYVGGQLRYTAEPGYFADVAKQMALTGALVLGGCCGTTPEHIAQIRDALRDVPVPRLHKPAHAPAVPVAAREPEPPQRAEAKPTGLQERLAAGRFVVTVELAPPRGFDVSETLERLRPVLPYLDAVNVADSPRAQGRMSALATASLIQTRLGVETILHMAIRHRNLLALHSDLLGAHALGVRNVFTVMGDVPLTGDYPQATSLADVTTSGLIGLIDGFNRGVDANGHAIEAPTSFAIGAALNLGAPDLDRELRVLERKVAGGADFLLTQPVYDPELVDRVARRLGGFPLPVIMGVLPLRTLRHARFLHHEVPGITVPDEVFERIERAGEEAAAEGIALSQELLRTVRGSIAGAYFMPPFGRFQVIPETLEGLDLS